MLEAAGVKKSGARYDRWLFLAALALLILSIVLIGSASIMEALTRYGDSMFLLKKHGASIVVAIACGVCTAGIPTKVLKNYSLHILLVVIFLMLLVLVVGREINHAKRWLNLGIVNLQPAEFLKLVWILYFSNYASHKSEEIRASLKGFIKPIAYIFIVGLLLLAQPDFGSFVVVSLITICIMWVAGARFLNYLLMGAVLICACGILVLVQPYRRARVLSFMDPWEDKFGSGYQLTQSLMAFGRGGLDGEGLGNSIQKLGYLPEAHTDFVTSILGEEFGFIGMCVVIALEFFIIIKALHLGFKLLRKASVFQGYVAYAIGLWFCFQTFINIGAASGALPTKGLTLPMISYGGSSLIVCCSAVAILLRIDFEFRNNQISFKKEDGL